MRVLRKFSIFSFCFVFNYLFCFVLSALKTPLLLVLLFLLVLGDGYLTSEICFGYDKRLRFRRSAVNRLYSIDK